MKLELTSIYLYPSLEVCTRQEQALFSFHFNLYLLFVFLRLAILVQIWVKLPHLKIVGDLNK